MSTFPPPNKPYPHQHRFDEVVDAVMKLNPFAPDRREMLKQMHMHAYALADEMTIGLTIVHQMVAFLGVEMHGVRDQRGCIHIIATIAPSLVNGEGYSAVHVGNA